MEFLTQDAWERARRFTLGGSEVAALFGKECLAEGQRPYKTHYQLWQEKAGNYTPPPLDSDLADIGHALEEAAMDIVCAREGLKRKKFKAGTIPYVRDNQFGCSPDGIAKQGRAVVVLEAKTVSKSIFDYEWPRLNNGDWDLPLQYHLQLQYNMGMCGATRGLFCIVVLGDNSREVVHRWVDFKPGLYATIVQRVGNFWQSIKDNTPPEPDTLDDAQVVQSVLRPDKEKTTDMRGSDLVTELVQGYLQESSNMQQSSNNRERIKTQLILMTSPASKVITDAGTISNTQQFRIYQKKDVNHD